MSTEKKSWQETLGQINLRKVLFALGTLISLPSFYFIYFVRDEGLFTSLVVVFMALWLSVWFLLVCSGVLVVSIHLLMLLRVLLRPILRWFMN